MISEFGKSRELGFATGWDVYVEYEIANGLVRPKTAVSDHVKVYAPLSYPILTNLAKIQLNDESAVLSFITKYGLLGYDHLVNVDSRLGGDPLKWIWAHSYAIRLCLDLLKELQAHDDENVCSILRDLPQANAKTLSPIVTHAAAEKIAAKPWFIGNKPDKNISPGVALGRKIVSDLINANIRGICPRLSFQNSEPRIFWRFGALIEVAYWKLANLATGHSGRVVRCEAVGCGARFIQTDGRQRFCPPDQPKEESRCAIRQRVRNNRGSRLAITGKKTIRPKGGSKYGKTTR
jgi:hypothetical protein